MAQADYPICVRALIADEGGGYLVEFPGLPGCMSDGDTVAEAVANAADAQAAWLAAMREAGRPIPAPGADPTEGYSGKWVLRAPRPCAGPWSSGRSGKAYASPCWRFRCWPRVSGIVRRSES